MPESGNEGLVDYELVKQRSKMTKQQRKRERQEMDEIQAIVEKAVARMRK